MPALLLLHVPLHFRHADILSYFAQFGPIESLVLAGHDLQTGRHAGIAWVQFRQMATLPEKEAIKRAQESMQRALEQVNRAGGMQAVVDSTGLQFGRFHDEWRPSVVSTPVHSAPFPQQHTVDPGSSTAVASSYRAPIGSTGQQEASHSQSARRYEDPTKYWDRERLRQHVETSKKPGILIPGHSIPTFDRRAGDALREHMASFRPDHVRTD